MIKALTTSLNADLCKFSLFLQQQHISHNITEERGKIVVWVSHSQHAALVQQYFDQWHTYPHLMHVDTPSRTFFNPASHVKHIILWITHIPVTFSVIFLSLLMSFFIYWMPHDFLQWFIFLNPNDTLSWMQNHGTTTPHGKQFEALVHIFFETFFTSHQWWRLITPMFLHFSLLHIASNATMFLFFGQCIEMTYGSRMFLVLILISCLCANFAQCFTGSLTTTVFGGLSGVSLRPYWLLFGRAPDEVCNTPFHPAFMA